MKEKIISHTHIYTRINSVHKIIRLIPRDVKVDRFSTVLRPNA